MSWMTEIADTAALRERTLRSITVPMGMANPLWLAFGAAASAGAAWWLMTRWAAPFNVESAQFAGVAQAPEPTPARPTDERTPESTPVLLDVALAVAPAFAEAAEAPVEAALEAAHVAVGIEAETAQDVIADAQADDDLTRLLGVGPRTAAALMERGVTRFAQLAAWTEDQMAAFDAELKLKGRSVRDAWLDQARRLAAEA